MQTTSNMKVELAQSPTSKSSVILVGFEQSRGGEVLELDHRGADRLVEQLQARISEAWPKASPSKKS